MDDKKKKRSPKPCLAQPAQAPGTLRRVPVPTSHSGSLALGLPHLPSPKQRAKFKSRPLRTQSSLRPSPYPQLCGKKARWVTGIT
uniref:Coiled-coil domain containing 28B n=3 Tax=Homininae TaxID=207598 RepID=A0A2I3TIZ2_PANTR